MCRATEPLQLGFGLGIRVVCAGQGLRISRGLGAWLKLKSRIRSPRKAAFSRTSVLGILRHLAAAGLLTLGDKGYHGAGEPAITRTRAATSRNRRRRPTVPTPSYAAPANAPTPSSRPGASSANSAAARGRPGGSPRPSTPFKPAKSEDEKVHCLDPGNAREGNCRSSAGFLPGLLVSSSDSFCLCGGRAHIDGLAPSKAGVSATVLMPLSVKPTCELFT